MGVYNCWSIMSPAGYIFVSEVWPVECHSSDKDTETFTVSNDSEMRLAVRGSLFKIKGKAQAPDHKRQYNF